jgi:hypothetical protein
MGRLALIARLATRAAPLSYTLNLTLGDPAGAPAQIALARAR